MNQPTNPPDLPAQLDKIADHLVFLEKKIDTLLEQTKEKKSFNGGFGNRPYRNPNSEQRPGYAPNRLGLR